jgi:hypothetical protein
MYVCIPRHQSALIYTRMYARVGGCKLAKHAHHIVRISTLNLMPICSLFEQASNWWWHPVFPSSRDPMWVVCLLRNVSVFAGPTLSPLLSCIMAPPASHRTRSHRLQTQTPPWCHWYTFPPLFTPHPRWCVWTTQKSTNLKRRTGTHWTVDWSFVIHTSCL